MTDSGELRPSGTRIRRDELAEALLRHAGVGIAVVDLGGFIKSANPALERMSGYSEADLCGMTLEEITHPEDVSADHHLLRDLLEGSRSKYQTSKRFHRKDGETVWGQLTVSLLPHGGASPMALAIVEDVTSRRAAEELARVERAYLDNLFDSIPEGVALVDAGDRIFRINQEFTRLFGYAVEEARGRRLADLIVPVERQHEALSITKRVSRGERVRTDTVRRRKDGGLVEVSVVGAPVRFDKRDIAVYGIYQDIGERKELERALRRESSTDELTGVLNRRGFLQLAEREWRLARRRNQKVTLIYIDVDRFKDINDQFGHEEGDNALRTIASMIQESFRTTDLVARMGGDEFVTLAVEAESEKVLLDRLEDAVEALNAAATLDYPLSMSVGAVSLPARSVPSVEELLKEADRPMYEEKRRKRRHGGCH